MDLQRQIAQLITLIIRESTGREVEVTPEDRLIESGMLDSLSMVSLVMALRTDFDVDLEINDLNEETFGSVASIAALVSQRRAS
jgi:acyl carrier protein